MAKKITKTAKRHTRITNYADTAKIKVVKPYEAREGSNVARVWAMVAKAKTIGQYKALRAKARKGNNVGGMLAGFVNNGYVRISSTTK